MHFNKSVTIIVILQIIIVIALTSPLGGYKLKFKLFFDFYYDH